MPIPFEQTLDRYEAAFGIRPGVGPDSERVEYLRCLHKYCWELPKPAVVVELGCYRGASTAVMACALWGTGSKIVTVDPVFETGEYWCKDPCAEGRVRYASELRNVVNRWHMMGVDSLVSVVPATSNAALASWDGLPIDMALCDAEHTREAVREDCRWAKHVKIGGIYVLDDWIEPVKQGANDYFANLGWWKLVHESTSAPTDQWGITAYRRDS